MAVFNVSEIFLYNGFNMFFVLLGLVVTAATSFAAYDYLKENKFWYYILNLFYILGFFLVITTRSWFVFIIGWEVVTVATTFMIIWSDKDIARQYFLVQFTGSSILLYVILLAVSMGYNTVGVINETWLQVLFVVGVGMKSGILGLHFWLPPIHSKAPAPVSAVLSGWVVKLGFITLLKIITGTNQFLLIMGFLMIFYGGIKALLQTDLKVLLAYSTISQLGFIAIGIGSGSIYGTIGAVFHITAHSLAKTNLFINSGFLEKEYKTRTIYDIDKIWKRSPVSALAIIVSLLSLMGTFFLTGYHSKYFIKYSLKSVIYLKLLFHGASIVTVLYSLRLIWWLWIKNIFNKNKKEGEIKKRNFSPGEYGYSSILFLIFALFFTGISPRYIYDEFFMENINFHFIDGITNYFLYLLLAVLILWKLNWIKTKEKSVPELDDIFKKVNNFLYKISGKFLEYDTGVFFESYLYNSIYKISQSIYNLIYTDFQLQLLWIPTLLMLLYMWISFIT